MSKERVHPVTGEGEKKARGAAMDAMRRSIVAALRFGAWFRGLLLGFTPSVPKYKNVFYTILVPARRGENRDSKIGEERMRLEFG